MRCRSIKYTNKV